MFINQRVSLLLLVLICTAAASAHQNTAPSPPVNGRVYLDVVVSHKSGPAVPDLQQQDFTILDNKAPQTITSFKAVSGREATLEVILVLDTVNSGNTQVAYERIQFDQFLRADGGRLAYPTALAILTNEVIRIEGNLSSDGNALSAALDAASIGYRTLESFTGYYAASERFQVSVKALGRLVMAVAPLPGRKLILWVSPGWPLLADPRVALDSKQQQQLFARIVSLSTRLRQGRITLYSIDPLNVAATATHGLAYYGNFLKGVSKPGQVFLGDLGLQVIAIQSGGLAFPPTNNFAPLLQQCVSDSLPYYEISFDPPHAEHADEYHHLEIKVAKPGLTARTRQGYYAQP